MPPAAARTIREAMPARIASSRMARRWEPQEGAFTEPVAKSRWCVRGHQDPDTGSLSVFSPTLQTTAMILFL
eukprot:9175564-Pyramimonas_sp.AAC.1